MNLVYIPNFVVILFINVYPLRASVKDFQCTFGSNVGLRNATFCHVVIQQDVTGKAVSVGSGATVCGDYKGVVAHYILASAADVLPALAISLGFNNIGVNDSHVVGPYKACPNINTDGYTCYAVCRFHVCSSGNFGPPACKSVCGCKHDVMCDIVNGSCADGQCKDGFYKLPLCQESCNCYTNAHCDADGRCPFGCRKGWTGADCQQRLCRVGFAVPPDCKHVCHCEDVNDCDILTGRCAGKCAEGWGGRFCAVQCALDEGCEVSCLCSDPDCDEPPGRCKCNPGWKGNFCEERACPYGYFEPPECSKKCHCENDRFCNPETGDCMGTRCEHSWSGPSCQVGGCPLGSYGPPLCSHSCYCANYTYCHPETGICAAGCKYGWYGQNCNIGRCKAGLFDPPHCLSSCKCQIPASCNTVTSECERGGCVDGLLGKYCNLTTAVSFSVVPYKMHTNSTQLAIVGACFIGALCVAYVCTKWFVKAEEKHVASELIASA
ncbi:multiple epidermal growth factor-like domains protein 10 [Physella acuta]|uniref:multiple epidermal growth factor-like domains protein 10 n=1 Tax=Physella acuta TaxID=109671 RepID=UPI0027DC4934|nr:multiple epidermal growth factor-like domains protein 10 [Physella acuta]